MSKRKTLKKATDVEDDLRFFLDLDNRLWEVANEGEHPSAHSIGQYHIETDDEYVTKKEWDKIKELITKYKLICRPGSGVFGLGIAFSMYRRPQDAPFPGTEEAFEPEFLLCLTHAHMQKVLGLDRGPELINAWADEFIPLVYNEENEAMNKKYMDEPLREISYYMY